MSVYLMAVGTSNGDGVCTEKMRVVSGVCDVLSMTVMRINVASTIILSAPNPSKSNSAPSNNPST